MEEQNLKFLIVVFNETEFPIAEVNERIWFHAQTVTNYLEFKNVSEALKYSPFPKKTELHFEGVGSGTFLDTSTVIRLCLRSKNPEALNFQNWVVENCYGSLVDFIREQNNK